MKSSDLITLWKYSLKKTEKVTPISNNHSTPYSISYKQNTWGGEIILC